MAVIASLVVGADGSSTLHGSSESVTTHVDRQRFLTRRRLADAILIGGNTARNERYQKTPVPLVILSHTRPDILDLNSKACWWVLSPTQAVARAQWEIGSELAIEGGIAFIAELLTANLLTQLELSITPQTGGEGKIDFRNLLLHFEKITTEEIEGTIFHTCTLPILSQK
jgi:riboflavin biosynthesis pyrimidine reductase